ncbi:TIGR04141 family sporadically distributed protein [Oceanicoccus sp. KOV_DT_Chl]|uniref:TIGR04141 family sporadically distributed protein n=1 Tax=Oceanicoccus sp. KOV_DT_Chl TaxID=1904639 RepID=UPI00135CAC6D|nr:TIGR04141 family sporadically distributed protein [Oceanicoccus sp. KOV_DT_Chl]
MAKNKSKADKEIIKDIDALSCFSINLDGAEEANLYIRKAEPHPPSWATLFAGHVDKKEIGNSSSPGAVLVIELKQAKFMITFGLGRHLIQESLIQRDYGLKVALNSIGEDKLRSIDKASHERTPLNSRTQASKGVDIFELALNTEVDLLTAITGSSKVEKFGAQVTGRDALTLNVKEGLDGFCGILKETHKFYKKGDYKKSFGWVDNFRRIKDDALLDNLDLKLLKLLKTSPIPANCWLAEPEIIDWEATSFYVLEKKGKRTNYYPELRLNKLIEVINSKNNSYFIEDIRKHTISSTDDNYNVIKSWSAYNCLYAEINDSGSLYILQNGSWFNVEDDFVNKVNSAISKIDNYTHKLPIYDHDGEGAYNDFVATHNSYVLMDRKNVVHGGGRSSIEYCDLIKDGADLIHVKRGTASSSLSHLFAQGEVSAELFSSDSKFRAALNKKLPTELKIKDVNARPDTGDYKIVYAIVSEKAGVLTLPFFSKVRLKNAYYHVNNLLGYQMAICKIDVSNNYKVKSKGK